MRGITLKNKITSLRCNQDLELTDESGTTLIITGTFDGWELHTPCDSLIVPFDDVVEDIEDGVLLTKHEEDGGRCIRGFMLAEHWEEVE